MKLIKAKYEILESQGIFKDIELAGRTCYKSEDKITKDSANKFVEMLIKRNHTAMLEHGTVYLNVLEGYTEKYYKDNPMDSTLYSFYYLSGKYSKNKYSSVNILKGDHTIRAFITTNYRVLVENGWLDDLKFQCEPTEFHEKRISVRFTCDIGVSREFNRHRVNSIAEQSTRYCNFSKEQFGNEITFIQPNWISDEELLKISKWRTKIYEEKSKVIYEQEIQDWNAIDWWLWSLACAELAYINMVKLGWTAQQARDSLPLSTKTELIHTAFISDWKHFFDLRVSTAAHPQARELAEPLEQEMIKLNLL